MKFPSIAKESGPIEIGGKTFKNHVSMRTTAIDLLEYYSQKRGNGFLNMPHNQKEYVRIESDGDRSKFCGGTFAEITKPKTDFATYNKFQNELKSLSAWQTLQTTFAQKNKRKRVMNEYDGEWDYDRRFEIKPFSRRGLMPNVHKKVILNVGFSFHCGISASTINEYGAFSAAIASTLESNGIGVELNIFDASIDLIHQTRDLAITWLKIKRFDEYLPSQMILQLFNANFFRRVLFGCKIKSSDDLNKPVHWGLGEPFQSKTHWECMPGTIYLHSCKLLDRQNDCITDILKSINGGAI